ncbi:hypothetical protein NIES2107_23100 [Nostoc carneum NIES-2107]|nr:hypothetical protein NIES2107_23100 [Nostoc carneum NIES-2107]
MESGGKLRSLSGEEYLPRRLGHWALGIGNFFPLWLEFFINQCTHEVTAFRQHSIIFSDVVMGNCHLSFVIRHLSFVIRHSSFVICCLLFPFTLYPNRQSPIANRQSPVPNRQSPIPSPQSPKIFVTFRLFTTKISIIYSWGQFSLLCLVLPL